jgi:hypothetical protein
VDTVWDSEEDAAEFVDAVDAFEGNGPKLAFRQGSSVRMLFGTDDQALAALRAALEAATP